MNNSLVKILVVDDDPDLLDLITDRLSANGFAVIRAANGLDALNAIKKEEPTIVFLDLQMPKMSGMDVLRTIKKEGINITVIVISAFGTIESAVEAIKEGAYDFIVKPFDPTHLEVVINKVLEREGLKSAKEYLSSQLGERYRFIIGNNPKMAEIVEMTKKVANSKSTVLLLGESGTGKEVIARSIHQWSDRAKGPFIPVNCVALSENLLESELFGHEKGAFTGAIQQKKGKLELADSGTLFLDEVGDISPSLQAKLLRVLQDHEFERVGGTKYIKVDIRVVAATNRDLNKAIADGKFREDLYYRLNVVNIKMLALRDRIDDIPILAEYFVNKFNIEMKKDVKKISSEAMKILLQYHWPGNIRELQNVIERGVVLCNGSELMPEDLPLLPSAAVQSMPELGFHNAIKEYKKNLIREALKRNSGSQAKTADYLDLQRTYLSRLIKELDINA